MGENNENTRINTQYWQRYANNGEPLLAANNIC